MVSHKYSLVCVCGCTMVAIIILLLVLEILNFALFYLDIHNAKWTIHISSFPAFAAVSF